MNTPGNALNITQSGLVAFDGTATFTGSPVTQFDVLVGGAANSVSSIGPGTAGQILQSGGNGANPAYSTATYPATAGANNNVLTSNGTNWVSSAPAAGGFSQINIQKFTASGTYTPTANMKYCIIEVVGGGGGSGGVVTGGSGQGTVSGGGGAGGYGRQAFSAASIGASQTVTCGADGTAGTNAGGTGGTGGTTTVGALISGTGGIGGSGAASAITGQTVAGGAGGTSSATFNITGSSGGYGLVVDNGTNAFVIPGDGGGSYLGAPTKAVWTYSAVNTVGTVGTLGGGASGSASVGGSGAALGGVGGVGVVVVTEYI